MRLRPIRLATKKFTEQFILGELYGGPPENLTRFQGVVGIRRVYGLDKLVYVPVPIEHRYAALDRGGIDVAVDLDHQRPAGVARRFLLRHGLL